MPIPTARQLLWQQTELAMFLHFGVNTFTNREWGEGTEDPAIFNPVNLDAGQWARTAKECGFGKLILTAKHHDGFCLWPSRYTEHSVKNSPWKNGAGDVVKELESACEAEGLQMGLYLSPWDRHEPSYGDSPVYNAHYIAQLQELATNYGRLDEFWFDGACGEGPNGRRQEYVFDLYWAMVRQLQPSACMFSDAGPDVRWIGNENGFAGETCWSMMDRSKVTIGKADTQYLNSGDVNGPDWLPGECDVSIRDGWFWHADQQPKSCVQLLDIYFKSVGRNGVLLLNVPPNPHGLLDEKDVARLKELKSALDNIFKINLAMDVPVKASHTRGGSELFSAAFAVDGNPQTYWAVDDSVRQCWIEMDFAQEKDFNLVVLREPVAMGQRIEAYHLDVFKENGWQTISKGTTIGNKKIDRFTPVKTGRMRLVIDKARACPLMSEVEVYQAVL
jgi:alpha-L-fucosidase